MTDTDDIRELRRELDKVVRMRGVERVAADIPASRTTVFRVLTGRTCRPSLAVREGIERVIDDAALLRDHVDHA